MDRIERALNGDDINLVYYDKTALMYASMKSPSSIEIVKLLLDRGADPNIQNEFGYTALIYSARNGIIENVKLLLDRGADPNIQNEFCETALMYSVIYGYTGIVKLLLDRGACPNIVNQHDRTAIMCATDGGLTDIVKLINDKINLQKVLQNLALAKSMDSPECDSPLQYLDYDTMKEIMICKRVYNHSVHMRMNG
jgi:ankyrin repeat protein